MSSIPLLSAAVSAATPVADRLQHLAEGLSFAATLAQRIASSGSDRDASADAGAQHVNRRPLASSAATNAHRLAQKSLDKFLVKFRRLASQHDVDGSQPIRLKSDGQSGVHVDGHHPDRAKIEQLLDSSPDLAASFRRLAAAQTTASQLSQPGERLRGEFRLDIQPNEVEVLFK